MNQVKCPNCGATTFSNVVADKQQKEITIACQYCNSQFKTENPDYVAEIQEPRRPTPAPVSEEEKQYKKYKLWSTQGYVGGAFMGSVGLILWKSYLKTGEGDKRLGAVLLLIGGAILIWSGWAYGKKKKSFQQKP
ncbi:hypothetical protein CLV59_103154 [Chitinophaga dinghuensis]|uniref:Uncharacterized protein n=1 Tax=Chitinophaga dinghuensis TaxID=1539050 RepID=A0A327W5A2_9BACT|nr:hypothetical protein [Chitinophaga dinghuensis]RAJ83194.1 hypothetical protein CLV59_103154 [Chitinophaga dinghuensis]